MTPYEKALDFFYQNSAYHIVGGKAYKPGLARSLELGRLTGNPHRDYHVIHVAGTNGKGSVAHLLAAVLQVAKYKVGLYTSPHVLDFCERIRYNGRNIPELYVADFKKRFGDQIIPLKPSFFEKVTCLAFQYFKAKEVDIAVVETGLGGRLDSTNIVTPILSIITNVAMDHMLQLGDTPAKIAVEKAGIIKRGVPVLIGEVDNQEVRDIFIKKAEEEDAPIYFAEEMSTLRSSSPFLSQNYEWMYESACFGLFTGELQGFAQIRNTKTTLAALEILKDKRYRIINKAVKKGFGNVVELTGLTGRWQIVRTEPTIVCDTGHNPAAWRYTCQNLIERAKKFKNIRVVFGMVNDKDYGEVIGLFKTLPSKVKFYFTEPDIERSLPVHVIVAEAGKNGITGKSFVTVGDAVEAAILDSHKDDFILISGSTFVVADALRALNNK